MPWELFPGPWCGGSTSQGHGRWEHFPGPWCCGTSSRDCGMMGQSVSARTEPGDWHTGRCRSSLLFRDPSWRGRGGHERRKEIKAAAAPCQSPNLSLSVTRKPQISFIQSLFIEGVPKPSPAQDTRSPGGRVCPGAPQSIRPSPQGCGQDSGRSHPGSSVS